MCANNINMLSQSLDFERISKKRDIDLLAFVFLLTPRCKAAGGKI